MLRLKQLKVQLNLILLLILINAGLLCFYSQTMVQDNTSTFTRLMKTDFESSFQGWKNNSSIKGHFHGRLIQEEKINVQNTRNHLNNKHMNLGAYVDRAINIQPNQIRKSVNISEVKEKNLKTDSIIQPDLRKERTNPTVTAKQYEGTKFIIYTRYRSGSSFLGDIFSQHHNVYYMFEPLKIFSNQPDSLGYVRDYAAHYLREMLNCRFEETIKDAREFSHNGLKIVRSIARRAFADKIPKSMLKKMTVKSLGKHCARHKHVLAKVISIYNIKIIQPLMSEGIKVINLVRDPRSTFASRCKLKWVHENRNKVEKQTLDDFYNQLLSNGSYMQDIDAMCHDFQSEFLFRMPALNISQYKSVYTLVRYEELAISPEKEARRLYEFAGIKMTSRVLQWIHNSTSGHNVTNSSNLAHEKRPLKLSYSTTRNSMDILRTWRRELPWKIVKQIQSLCRESMQLLGYKTYQNKQDLLSDSPDSIDPLLVNLV